MKINGIQWLSLLDSGLEDRAVGGDPVVIMFHNSVSRSDEGYKKDYKESISHLINKNATFVITMGLVEMSKQIYAAAWSGYRDRAIMVERRVKDRFSLGCQRYVPSCSATETWKENP